MAKVLIVDDEKSIRVTLAEFLKHEGHETTTESNLAASLKALEETEFDVLVTDIFLPDGDGLALIRYIREKNIDTEVIIMTGAPTLETSRQAIGLNVFDYIVKPVNRDLICMKVSRAANEKSSRVEKQQMQAEKEKYTHELEQLVGHRTAEINRLSQKILNLLEDERLNISTEIHNDWGQLMVALRLNLNMLLTKGTFSEDIEPLKAETLKIIEETTTKIRNLSTSLSPVQRNNMDIVDALAEMMTPFQNSDIDLQVDLEAARGFFPNGWSIDLYRIIQEALINIRKHSQADRVKIISWLAGGDLHLVIQDNGIGFSAENTAEKEGIGILLMHKRIENLHGILQVESDAGTRLSIVIPEPEQNQDITGG